MNLKVNLGKTKDYEDFFIDFEKQKIHLTLLVGATGTGKSVLGYHIYRQLIEQNTSDEIVFVLIDNIRIEFVQWNQKSPYLYCPAIIDHNLALEFLENLADKLNEINDGPRRFFIHIEECDLYAVDSKKLEEIFKKLFQIKEHNKIHLIFSTSRPSTEVITPWLLELTDLKIICQMASSADYITATGKDYSKDFTYASGEEKIAILNDQIYHLLPLTVEQVRLAEAFKL